MKAYKVYNDNLQRVEYYVEDENGREQYAHHSYEYEIVNGILYLDVFNCRRYSE